MSYGCLNVVCVVLLAHNIICASSNDNQILPRSYLYKGKRILINTTTDTVKVLRTISPCSNGSIHVYQDSIVAPNDSIIINISYESGLVEGPFEENFSVLTDGKKQKIHYYLLRGIVKKFINIKPHIINLNDFKIGSDTKNHVDVLWRRFETPIFKLHSAPDYLKLGDILSKPKHDSIWTIPVSLSETAQPKYYSDTLVLSTNSESWPFIKIPIEGRVQGVLSAIPKSIDFGNVESGKIYSNSFLVTSSVGIDSIISTAAKDERVLIKSVSKINRSKFRVNIQCKGNGTKLPIATKVQISAISGGKEYLLTVPVYGEAVE